MLVLTEKILVTENDILEMVQAEPLHFHHLVITSAVIEGVTPLREVIEYISRVEDGHQAAVHPGYAQQVFWNVNQNTFSKMQSTHH